MYITLFVVLRSTLLQTSYILQTVPTHASPTEATSQPCKSRTIADVFDIPWAAIPDQRIRAVNFGQTFAGDERQQTETCSLQDQSRIFRGISYKSIGKGWDFLIGSMLRILISVISEEYILYDEYIFCQWQNIQENM